MDMYRDMLVRHEESIRIVAYRDTQKCRDFPPMKEPDIVYLPDEYMRGTFTDQVGHCQQLFYYLA